MLTDCSYDKNELAERFYKLADKFEETYFGPKTTLHFSRLETENVTDNIAACFGSWGYLILGSSKKYDETNCYKGADLIAQFLGFKSYIYLLNWVETYPQYWGNRCGTAMFTKLGALAFGKSSKEIITLLDVTEHLRKVGTNLEKI